MPEVTVNDRQMAVVAQATKLYRDGKFKAALQAFKKGVLMCPCTRDVMVQANKLGLSLNEVSIPFCHCKDYLALSLSGPSKLAMYKLAKKPCSCGSGLFHCNASAHLSALEGMTATYEKLDAPVKARQHAALLITVSPRAPEGFLRLAKALRLCDNEQSPDTVARCRWIYRQALDSVQTYGNKDHNKLKVLISLLRVDIVAFLPAELQIMVLGHLDMSELCDAMEVSKNWKQACLDPALWTHLRFVRPLSRASHRPLHRHVFNNIISKRAQFNVKSLTLSGVLNFNIDLATFGATLKNLNRLESLALICAHRRQHEVPFLPWSLSLFAKAAPGLKTLHLERFATDDWGSSVGLYEAWPQVTDPIPMAQSLEELSLRDMVLDLIIPMMASTVWPKLRKLRISSTTGRVMGLNMRQLVRVTPALRDLCIRDFDPDNCSHPPSWKNLERLHLVPTSTPGVRHLLRVSHFDRHIPLMDLPPMSPTIRSLEFLDGATTWIHGYRKIAHAHSVWLQRKQHALLHHGWHTGPAIGFPMVELERLEHLSLRDNCYSFGRASSLENLPWFLEYLKPSMSNGSLTSLAVTFCPETRFELDRVLNKDAIRTLSCFDFNDQSPVSQCGNTLLHWLQGFRNLTTLGVFPERFEGCWMLICKVLGQESSIDTIYTNILSGVWRDLVLEKAEEKGVRIIEADRIPEPILQPLEAEP
ncbi:hypothetical protein diail_12017 [Diaporthe ilicicola]|nr:hypothetical protein diail_12017 [Diaporthe ilicicola]